MVDMFSMRNEFINSRTRVSNQPCQKTTVLFVQLLLPSLALILAALLLRHVLADDRALVRLVGGELGISRAAVVVDGLDRELLLSLCK